MNKREDADLVYSLLLTELTKKLRGKDTSPAILKLALDFIKTFELDAEIAAQDRDVEEFLEHLPFAVEE